MATTRDPSLSRRLVARMLPARARRALKSRLRGTRWDVATPQNRRFVLAMPGRAGILIDCPRYMFVPGVLETKKLAGYEPYAVECFLATIGEAGPGAVFDVGANVGIYALLAAAYGNRAVVAFEPAPDTAAVARETAARNDLAVTVEEIAISDATGSVTLYLSSSTDSSNSLNPDFRPHGSEIRVPAETLDDYVARTGVVPSVIKVDTETTEPQVLAGARNLIATHRPWIVCEVLWSLVEDRMHAVMDEFDYHYYHLDGPGPRPEVPKIVGDRTWTHYMYLLAPEPVSDGFWQQMNDWRQRLDAI